MDHDLIGILLIKSDSKGDRLLFRYPFTNPNDVNPQCKTKNPYSLPQLRDDPIVTEFQYRKRQFTTLLDYPDDALSTLFAVKLQLAETKLEIKVNEIRFVSYPTLVQPNEPCSDDDKRIMLNVVFVMDASADFATVNSYYEVSKMIGIALRHEERRCGYLAMEIKCMANAHDQITAKQQTSSAEMESLYSWILSECSLGEYLKSVYDDLRTKGFVNSKLNRWMTISYCIPHKVHNSKIKMLQMTPEDIQKCLNYIMPYHALLLLWEIKDILPMLPMDGSPHLSRFLDLYSPIKTLETISLATDMTLLQIFLISSHLIHWGMAIVIYPICVGNVYVVAPYADIATDSPLLQEFETKFNGSCLLEILSEFSTSLTIGGRFNKFTQPNEHQEFVQMIAWMLRHRLIQQLHTYPQYIPLHKSKLIPDDEESMSKLRTLLGNMRLDTRVSDIDIISKTVASEMSAADSDAEFKDSILGVGVGDFSERKPWYSDDCCEARLSRDSSDTESGYPESVSVEDRLLTEFTEEERQALLRIPGFSKMEYFKIFVRLLRRGLLTGERHVEHIMYVGNVSRPRLTRLLEKFSSVIVTSEKPDAAVAMFYPKVD